MNYMDLPPLPAPDQRGPEVCARVSLYIAVLQDLTPTQKALVSLHVQGCETCAQEYQLVRQATKLVSRLEASTPSARVDQAVMQAISAQRSKSTVFGRQRSRSRPRIYPAFQGGLVRTASWAAVVAALLIAVIGTLSFVPGLHHTSTDAFALPANLSWKPYVLYHSQTMTTENGTHYQVKSYHDFNAGMVNVETTVGQSVDVVVVQDDHDALGLDMMHHVAQWDAQKWSVDESMFDLRQLRSDLQSGHAVYLGKGTFQGQEVYRIRWSDNQILLLNMQYLPVNILQATSNTNTGQPEYDTIKWLKPSQVPPDMWDMNVPKDFKMGKLPAKP